MKKVLFVASEARAVYQDRRACGCSRFFTEMLSIKNILM